MSCTDAGICLDFHAYVQLFTLFYTHVMIGQEYKREDEVPNEGDVIVWTPEPQSAHLSAVLLPVECPNHKVLCQSGEEFYVSQVRSSMLGR